MEMEKEIKDGILGHSKTRARAEEEELAKRAVTVSKK